MERDRGPRRISRYRVLAVDPKQYASRLGGQLSTGRANAVKSHVRLPSCEFTPANPISVMVVTHRQGGAFARLVTADVLMALAVDGKAKRCR